MITTSVKLFVVGRSGTGKTRFANALAEKQNLKILKTYTTRPQRQDESDDTHHIFITPDEAKTYENKLSPVIINGYEYFTTKEQIADADIIVVEPSGIKPITDACLDTCFNLVYIEAENKDDTIDMIMSRDEDPEKAVEIYKKRIEDEDETFTEFEHQIDDVSFSIAPNCKVIHRFLNDYTEDAFSRFLNHISDFMYLNKQVTFIVNDLICRKRLKFDEETSSVIGTYRNKTGSLVEANIPVDIFVNDTACNSNQFRDIVVDWLISSEEMPVLAEREANN